MTSQVVVRQFIPGGLSLAVCHQQFVTRQSRQREKARRQWPEGDVRQISNMRKARSAVLKTGTPRFCSSMQSGS